MQADGVQTVCLFRSVLGAPIQDFTTSLPVRCLFGHARLIPYYDGAVVTPKRILDLNSEWIPLKDTLLFIWFVMQLHVHVYA